MQDESAEAQSDAVVLHAKSVEVQNDAVGLLGDLAEVRDSLGVLSSVSAEAKGDCSELCFRN